MWHSLTSEEAIYRLESDRRGLSTDEARRRLSVHGPNALPESKPKSIFSIALSQFKSPIIYILIVAAGIVIALGEYVDGAVIAAVLLINAVIGVIQEGKAQNALASLRTFVATNAVIMRGGTEEIIPDHEVVPGDIIMLEEGSKVPADARLVEMSNLRIDESALTGESEPVSKDIQPLPKERLQPADQTNMVFRGSFVVGGSGVAVVVGTGVSTVIGGISGRIQSIDADMPLKRHIAALSRAIILVVLAVAALIFVLGLLRGQSAADMFGTVVAISVSAIPEGLPVVVTLILATGVFRMGKRNALVRRLQAVEALGQARVLAVDKTGTITRNQMIVKHIYTGGKIYDVSGSGYEPRGSVTIDGSDASAHPDIVLVAESCAYDASSVVAYDETAREWKRLSGDPTETALVVLAEKLGMRQEDLLKRDPRILEIPFDSRIKYRASLNQTSDKKILTVIGAPDVLLPLVVREYRGGSSVDLEQGASERISTEHKRLMSQGLRVLAIARADDPDEVSLGSLPPLSLVALVGIRDDIKPEVHDAVSRCQEAGIRVIMLTGDHRDTAVAVAREVGIYREGDDIIVGSELDASSMKELTERAGRASVFARVTPEHKLAIIDLYRERGETIAMTGDGVNDALSLVAADLGVAMGKNGTEVAKEASDIVLLDDNFGTVVAAVEEGRNIYATIKKVVVYLFSTSLGEILTIIGALSLGLPIPLSASQIIWLNFVTDGMLVAALAFEPREHSLKLGRMRSGAGAFLDTQSVVRMVFLGAIMMIGALSLYHLFLPYGFAKASTVTLTVLAAFQWFNAWNVRSATVPVSSRKLAPNRALYVSLAAAIALQVAAVYTPLGSVLGTEPLAAIEWMFVIAAAAMIFIAEDARKYFFWTRSRASARVG